jgi:ATP-dependent exoDNAse (exonuclease V) alpha subunit
LTLSGPRRPQASGPCANATNPRRFAVGDEVVGTRNDRSLRVANGDIGTISAVDIEAGTATVTLAARRSHPERDVVLPGGMSSSTSITATR